MLPFQVISLEFLYPLQKYQQVKTNLKSETTLKVCMSFVQYILDLLNK